MCIISSNPPNSRHSDAAMEARRRSGTCPRLGQSQGSNPRVEPLSFPTAHFPTLPPPGVCGCVCCESSVCYAVMYLPPTPPVPHITRSGGSLGGSVFMGMGRAGEGGLCWALNFPHGAINQGQGEKD